MLGFTEPRPTTALESTGFKPAKAICRNTTGTSSVLTQSKITGRKYGKKANRSFTFPIGRTSERPSWSAQKSEITAKISASEGNKSVLFKAEVY